MSLSQSVEESLREAEGNLRNALAFSARNEKPYIAKHIADMILAIDTLISTDAFLDKIDGMIGDKK